MAAFFSPSLTYGSLNASLAVFVLTLTVRVLGTQRAGWLEANPACVLKCCKGGPELCLV